MSVGQGVPVKPSDAEAVLLAVLDALSAGEPEQARELLHPALVYRMHNAQGVLTVREREDYLARWAAFFASSPDLHVEVLDRVGAGDRMALQYRVAYTSRGRPQERLVAGFVREIDGCLAEHDEYITSAEPLSD